MNTFLLKTTIHLHLFPYYPNCQHDGHANFRSGKEIFSVNVILYSVSGLYIKWR